MQPRQATSPADNRIALPLYGGATAQPLSVAVEILPQPIAFGAPEVTRIDVQFDAKARRPKQWRALDAKVRNLPLIKARPWVRSVGKLELSVSTRAWRFPTPLDLSQPGDPAVAGRIEPRRHSSRTKVRPPSEVVQFKDRLLYVLQPPLEDIFHNRVITLPFEPYPYQLKGIAFLMPRHAALIADEMGLGKTAQVLIALRLMLHGGMIENALIVCPKPLVVNWGRELRLWAPDIPFEIIAGDSASRKAAWFASRCPVKLVNYELLTRDIDWAADERLQFDVVVLDEAQRIKNKESKTAHAAKRLHRRRSWAMSGTPVENRTEDLINLFAFLDPGRIPPDIPARQLRELTADAIIRRVKEDVVSDMPPKVVRDAYLDLSDAQRDAYDKAEKEGIIHLNELGETITVQHVFELVMRLKQICNFDPLTGESVKLEQLVADMAEVAANRRKAIVFSQWIEPLERIAEALRDFGPLQYHGKIPHAERQRILDRFQRDPSAHVILMSYGTGSVGLNLQFANYVFLFDRWWNPAIEDQAINRAHRLGQKDPVFVTRFICQNTIEERINEILERKRRLFQELIADSGPPEPLGLNEEEIFGLFEIQARPHRRAA